MIGLDDARAMVAQFAWHARPSEREAIARHMVATGACVLHACWELYGRAKGLPCACTSCLEAPMPGEVVLRILVQGQHAPGPTQPQTGERP